MFGRLFNRLSLAPLVAEFLGVTTLTTVALVMTQTTAVSYFIATSVAVALAVIVMAFGAVSGGHFNPALTFGMWTARRIGTLRAISYIAAQMLGGLAGWQILQYLLDKPIPARSVTFSSHLWAAEVVGTFILATGFAAAASRAFDALQSALVYGAAIFSGIMVASVSSAGLGLLNPALALGLRSWGTVYILGPLVGALLAVNLYYLLFAPLTAAGEGVGLAASRTRRVAAGESTATTTSARSSSSSRKSTTKTAAKKPAARSRRASTSRRTR
jgi:glycerol uptake facilitator-like aquaporin